MYPRETRNIPKGKKVFFASDFHLGIDGKYSSREREKLLTDWLSSIKGEAEILFLVGDLFDYWFEYKQVVPKGFVRILGKLAELSDNGVEIVVFTGNHDMWMFHYLQDELGAKLYKTPVLWNINNKVFLIGHGDGLGPGDHGYKFIKWVFNHPVCQWLFARIHPNTGIGLMRFFSGKSRAFNSTDGWNEQKEWLVQFCEDYISKDKIDFFVFGHRHLVIDYLLSNQCSRYINLGDWFQFFSYATFQDEALQIEFCPGFEQKIMSNTLR